MKTLLKCFLIFNLLMCSIYSNAQNEVEYKIKYERYKSMEHTGKVLKIGGITGTALGATSIIISFIVFDENDESTWKTSDAFGYPGLIIGSLGVVSLINGIIFQSIGKRKAREYQIRLENLNISSYCSPDHSGFRITYRF